MNINRRNLFSLIPAVALAACAQQSGGGATTTSNPGVPTLDQIKSLAAVTVAELPLMVDDLQNSGGLKGQQLLDARKAVTAAQQILPQVEALQPNQSTPVQIASTLTALINALQIVLSLIPQTAPYAPAVGLLTALVQAYLLGLPPAPAGTTTPIAPPTGAWHSHFVAR